MATSRICSVDDCGKPFHAHGYCARHAYHFKAHGNPLGGRKGSSPGEPIRWIETHATYEGDECLVWPFEVGNYGYGVVKEGGRKRVASRVMCERVHGHAPDLNMDAAHSCGNGHNACMTPRHLSWKTRAENVADAVKHGTWKRGSNDRKAKLTEDDVREIRRLAGSHRQEQIAALFGVQASMVSRIIARKRWAWLD